MLGHVGLPCADIAASASFADRAAVDALFAATVAAHAEEPRVHPEYHETYYGAFVRDLDGNNVEAVSHGPA